MKNIAWLLKILIPVLVVTVVVVAFAGVPRWMHMPKPKQVATIVSDDSGVTYTPEEEHMLKEVIAVYARMDFCRQLYTTGILEANDPADSTVALHSPFKFCRKGNDLYYQSGEMEVIALENIYISISNQSKKIFVGPARKIISPLQMATDSLVDIWKKDHYSIDAHVLPEQTTVRLLCSNHITCKEYRYDYDPAAMVLKGVYMRLTNLDDPLNTAMDKEVRMSVDQWRETDIPPALLKTGTYLAKGKAGWEPVGAYADYTLISLF